MTAKQPLALEPLWLWEERLAVQLLESLLRQLVESTRPPLIEHIEEANRLLCRVAEHRERKHRD